MSGAPYPAETRAKGWRFELDHERIRQSDTWALAPADVRPWLLMLWMVAWEQTPCGSMPADDALIAARIGMPAKTFAKVRDVLMRGWAPADDGRLYHATMTERVLEMLDYRAKNAKRVADFKARMREQQGANALPQGEQPAKNDTGTGTGTGTTLQDKPVEKTRRGKRAVAESVSPELLSAFGFTAHVAEEFIAHKLAMKAPLTHRAWLDHCAEAGKAGWTPVQAAEKVMAKGWKGFEAKYVASERPGQSSESPGQRAARARVESIAPGVAARPVTEIFDVTARLVG